MRGWLLALVLVPALASATDVTGRVRFEGTPPKPPAPATGRDKGGCGKDAPVETLVVAEDGALANVVVSIAAPGEGAPREVAIGHERCRFVPHVAATTLGSTLAISNSDPLLHRVVATTGSRQLFTWPLAVVDKPRHRRLATPGVVDLRCDAGHPWSSAYVHVFAHPHFAVSGADGRFSIAGVPDGTWTATAWHEKLGTQTIQLVVKEGATLDLTFRDR